MSPDPRSKQRWFYVHAALGVAFAAAGWGLRLLIEAFPGSQAVFLPFFPAVIAAAMLLGFWGGAACTAASLGIILATASSGLVAGAVFAVSGLLMSFAGGRARRARRFESTFTKLVERAPFGVYVIDADFRLARVNDGAQAVFSALPRPVIGRDFAEVLRTLWPQPFADRAITAFRRTLETGEPYVAPTAVEQRADVGVVESYDWQLQRVTMPDGRYGVVCYFYDLTKQNALQDALRQSEDRYRALFESMDEGYCVIEVIFDGGKPVDYRFLETNPAFEKQTGLVDAKGKRMRTLAPEHEEHWFEVYGRVAMTGEAVRFEGLAAALNRWYDVYAFRIRPAELRQVGIVFNDITNRRRGAVRNRFLVRLDDRLRTLTDPAEITAAAARALGEHLRVNRCAYADVEGDEDTFNLTGDYNNGVPSIIGRYRFADFGGECLRLMRADEPYVVDDAEEDPRCAGVRAAYRATRIRSVICVPLHKGGRLAAAMAVHQNQPRRWRAEEVELLREVAARCWESIERARAERLLRDSERRFRATIEQVKDYAIFSTDPEGRPTTWNEGVRRVLGYEAEEFIGRDLTKEIWTPEDQAAGVPAEELGEAARSGTAGNDRVMRRKDGSEFWASGVTTALRGQGGELLGFSKVMRDQTDLKRYQDALARREASLRRANEDLLQFASIASHDLKEPLRGIAMLASFVRDDERGRIGDDSLQKVERVGALAQRLNRMVSGLLEHARTGVAPELEDCDLNQIVARVVDTSAEELASKRCVVTIRGTLPTVRGDPLLVDRVFANLISNAVKFNTAAVKRVEIAWDAEAGAVAVRDNGIGIDPAHHQSVFRIFRRVHGWDDCPGEGLGLALVRKILGAQGGSIELDSEVGRGATFRVRLPVVTPGHDGPERVLVGDPAWEAAEQPGPAGP